MRQTVCASLLCLLAGTAAAADYRADAENYREHLRRLQPGDRLLLDPGDYLQGLPLHHLSGQAGQPIVIEAANPGAPPRFIARPRANTVSLVDVRHLVVRHLELDGRNLPVDAVKAEGHSRYADFITLEHLFIHDHAASQQNVGISTKCPAFGWVVRNNRIERVGTGMYFGDSDGSDSFVAGVIEGNRVTRTLGYNLQIKHQKARSPGDADDHDTVIRYNVFSKSEALPGPLARPNVLLGHVPLTGVGSEDRYLVYGNLFLHNPSEALLQAEGRLAVYDNVFINGSGDAIHIQPHNDVPRAMAIFSNTVAASGTGIQVRQAEDAVYRQRVIGNVVAAATPIQGGEAVHNVELAYLPEMLAVAVPELNQRLLAQAQPPARLPQSLIRELTAYPDWQRADQPGARIAPELLRALDAAPP
ncbi:MAG: right-handed parallel beta-helix repeat-containing protein [Thiobacillus sp.]